MRDIIKDDDAPDLIYVDVGEDDENDVEREDDVERRPKRRPRDRRRVFKRRAA